MDGSTLNFKKPASGTTVELTLGDALRNFSVYASGHAPGTVSVYGWDRDAQQTLTGTASSATLTASSDLATTVAEPDSAFGQATLITAGLAGSTQEEVTQLSQALIDWAVASSVRASGTTDVDPNLKLGTSVSISDAGPLSGSYPVTRVEHTYRPRRGFLTRFWSGGRVPSSSSGGNGRYGPLQGPATQYARRMTIEQRLAEIIRAFCADALSSTVNLNVDLDVMLAVLAQALTAALRARLPGYATVTPDTIQRRFLKPPAGSSPPPRPSPSGSNAAPSHPSCGSRPARRHPRPLVGRPSHPLRVRVKVASNLLRLRMRLFVYSRQRSGPKHGHWHASASEKASSESVVQQALPARPLRVRRTAGGCAVARAGHLARAPTRDRGCLG